MSIDWDDVVLGPLHEVFGNVSVLYTAGGRTAFALSGIFDRGYRQVLVLEDGGEAATSAEPVLGVRTAAMTWPPAQNDTFVVQSVTERSLQDLVGAVYRVREVRDDHHGEAKLMLNRATA